MDELTAAEPDPANRTDETNKRLNTLIAQRTVLEAFGESMVVTDDLMSEGTKAFLNAEVKYAKSEGMIIEQWRLDLSGDVSRALQNQAASHAEIYLLNRQFNES
jgi:hypothetical protein